MRYTTSLLFFVSVLAFSSCVIEEKESNKNIEIFYEFSELEDAIYKNKKKILVINFWATTCPPCLKEMPHFNELAKMYHPNDLKILLISLDNVHQLENKVIPFVKKFNIDPEVKLLADENYSAWTEKIDSTWYGAVSYTHLTLPTICSV